MGSKVVTIEPDYSEWKYVWKEQRIWGHSGEKPIQVIFTWSKPKLERGKRNQTVTHCLMRVGIEPIGQGFAVENPNDERNDINGIHWAFKRAIQSMLHRIEFTTKKRFSGTFKKRIDKAFRQALWEAMK